MWAEPTIVAAAPAADWVPIAPADLLVMTLAADARGKPRQVVIQLIAPPFSQPWTANIRALAKAHWWDGLAIVRAQWQRGIALGVIEAMGRPEDCDGLQNYASSVLYGAPRRLGAIDDPRLTPADLDKVSAALGRKIRRMKTCGEGPE